MPNWVTAKLTIEGADSAKVMKSLLTKNEENEIEFDFNKIIPMPKELNIISGSTTQKAIEIYLTWLNPLIRYIGGDNNDLNKFLNYKKLADENNHYSKFNAELSEEEITEYTMKNSNEEFKTLKDFITYGRKAIENIVNYGAIDWYDWCNENWGTKWNACHNIYLEEHPNQIYFDTAWSDVRGLILELSNLFPKNTFVYEYSEEQIGLYTGIATFKNGKVVEDIEFEDCSKEAYEKAFELWGEDLKEYYKFNKKKNTYEHIDDSGEMD